MVQRHQAVAEAVAGAFRDGLNAGARAQISAAEWEMLQELVREAVAEELDTAVKRMQDAIADIRVGIERHELGL